MIGRGEARRLERQRQRAGRDLRLDARRPAARRPPDAARRSRRRSASRAPATSTPSANRSAAAVSRRATSVRRAESSRSIGSAGTSDVTGGRADRLRRRRPDRASAHSSRSASDVLPHDMRPIRHRHKTVRQPATAAAARSASTRRARSSSSSGKHPDVRLIGCIARIHDRVHRVRRNVPMVPDPASTARSAVVHSRRLSLDRRPGTRPHKDRGRFAAPRATAGGCGEHERRGIIAARARVKAALSR